MGQDKALLPVSDQNGGGTLLTFMQRKLNATKLFDEIIICRNSKIDGIKNVRYLPDIKPGIGPIGALHALGIHYPDHRALIVPVDMPLLKAEQLTQLCKTSLNEHTGCYYEGKYFPLLIKFNNDLTASIAKRLEINAPDLSIACLLDDIQSTTLSYQGDYSHFANVNTLEEWQALKL